MAVSNTPIAIGVPEPVPPLLRDLIHERTGMFFEAARFDTMLEKLEGRAIAQGCRSFLDYYYLLKYEDQHEVEWRRVMDAFSVQETYFWREFDQIRALVEVVVPAWFKQTTAPLKIWSAACATGEEPYTIAMALQEAGWGAHPIEIRASDASEAALEKARAGIYRERSFRTLSADLRQKYFRPVTGGYEIDRSIASRVRFQRANLVVPAEIADLANASVVFCRNVFIYFSPAAITRVVGSFAVHMRPGSHLFIGASESLLKLTRDFDLAEIQQAFVYRRVTDAKT
jgi:chemotaxis protein methyltransferase CheR